MSDSVCSRCGKSLSLPADETDKNIITFDPNVAISALSLPIELTGNERTDRLMKNLLGKYEPGTYSFCYECILDALMGAKN
jgi:hypothetical protein